MHTMDDQASDVASAEQWHATLARRFDERRAQAQAALEEQRDRIRNLEQLLDQSLQQLAGELNDQSRLHDKWQADHAQHQIRQSELDAARESLATQRREWEANQLQAITDQQKFSADLQARALEHSDRQAKLAEQAQKLSEQQQALAARELALAQRQTELESRLAQLEQQQSSLELAQAQLDEQRAAFDQQHREQLTEQLELEQQRAQLVRDQEALAERDRESQKQRRHVAQQLRSRKKELAAEIELHRSEALSSAQGQELQLQMRLTELQARFDRLQDELNSRDQQREELLAKLAQQQPALDQSQSEIRRLADALRQAEMQQQVAQGESQRYRDMLTQERETADRQRESLRQQAALQTDKLRNELQGDLEKARHELASALTETTRLQEQLAQAQLESERRLNELQLELQSGSGQNESLQRQFKQWEDERTRLQIRLDEQMQERAALETECDQLRQQAQEFESAQSLWLAERTRLESQLETAAPPVADPDLAVELDILRTEKRQLETALALAQKNADSAGNPQEMDDLRRRFEMAVQDVRELKSKNADLADQLAKAKQAAGKATGAGAPASGAMDWETRKQQLLAKLEADVDESDEKGQADRLTIEGTIRMTDQIVADKERELVELRKLLEDQSSNIGGLAVGAAAIAGMLDGDELIKQERDNLKQMQEQMREQLKRAEIDISVERAKLARERAEVEEKLRAFESEKGKLPIVKDSAPGDKRKAGGGRWLSKLGLSGDES
jgi:chromosome segregation ATPase